MEINRLANLAGEFFKKTGKKEESPVSIGIPVFKGDKLSLSGKASDKNISTNIPLPQFVKNENGNFTIDGKPFKFIGTNMYSLARENSEVSTKMLEDAAKEGFTVIRFWAGPPLEKEKMKELCDTAGRLDLKLVPCLANNWNIPEEERKGDSWYKEGYKKEYLPYVKDMAEAFKNRPEIMIWELINEPETEHFDSIYNFSKNVSEQIDAIDKNHLISIGTVGGMGDKFGNQFSRFNERKFEKLYSLPQIDAVSIHDYSYDARVLERADIFFRMADKPETAKKFQKWDNLTSLPLRAFDRFMLEKFDVKVSPPLTLRRSWINLNDRDYEIAKDLKKPLYVGEVGFKKEHGVNRKKLFDLDIQEQIGKGAQGYMLWSFEAQGKSVDGHDYGFSQKDGFADLIQGWNKKLNSENK